MLSSKWFSHQSSVPAPVAVSLSVSRYSLTAKMIQKRNQDQSVTRAVRQYVDRAIHGMAQDKFFTQYLTTALSSIGNSWVELNLVAPTQGSGLNNRKGSTIMVRSIEINGVLVGGQSDTVADDDYNVVRAVIAAYVGDDDTPLAGAGLPMTSPLNREIYSGGRLKYKLMDKFVPLPVSTIGISAGYASKPRVFSFRQAINQKITYGTSGIGAPNQRLILSMISDSSAVPNPGFVTGFINVLFEDM